MKKDGIIMHQHYCRAIHPTTGDTCLLLDDHNQSEEIKTRQHIAFNGVKWPHLHALDPSEGYNPPMPFRI